MKRSYLTTATVAFAILSIGIAGCGELETGLSDVPVTEAFFTSFGVDLGNHCYDVGNFGFGTGVTASADGTEVFGTKGDDVIDCTHRLDPVTIHGGKGNDNIAGGYGDDLIKGGQGNDELCGGPVGVIIGVPCYEQNGDFLLESDGNDVIEGGQGDDFLDGGYDDDELYGGRGDDELYGGPGNDFLEGGREVDHLNGGDGTDSCDSGPGADLPEDECET